MAVWGHRWSRRSWDTGVERMTHPSPEHKPRPLSPTQHPLPSPIQPVVKEFKVGSWGGRGTAAKRAIREQLFERGAYIMSTWGGKADMERTCRVNEMAAVEIGSRFYMREKQFTYIGVVTSAFRSLSRDELFTNYAELVQVAWGGELPDDRDGFFKMCNVSWEKVTLTDELDYQLRKTTKNGGRCMKQCGTIIPLH